MTARVLVVDDIPANVKLLEARLMAEYFQVLTANNGATALEICQAGNCDVVLLDVMMPEIDGFEVCRRLKENPGTMHIPVVMVTALDHAEDRLRGLEAGADDFLTKPVNDLALITRVKSLARLKMLTDELRSRAATGKEMGVESSFDEGMAMSPSASGKILVVDDKAASYERLVKLLSREHEVAVITDPQEALFRTADEQFDVALISLSLSGFDALRLCSQLRSLERTRTLPLVVVAELEQENKVIRALDMGVNDFLRRPIDPNELLARIRTQVKRKRYNDSLHDSVQQTIEMAVTDGLTGLNNRRYLDSHLAGIFGKATARGTPLSAILCDIDHFKLVNDNHGHDVGDEVLKEFARRVKKNIRNIDLAARYGGEEFVIIMPDTNVALARIVAERIRTEVCAHPFIVDKGRKQLQITASLGVTSRVGEGDTPEQLIKRADNGLYAAKRNGRNRVVMEAA